MENQSEELRDALRAAEAAIRATLALTDPEQISDHAAIKDIVEARELISRRRRDLEGGAWPGRTVSSYPAPRERVFDGTS